MIVGAFGRRLGVVVAVAALAVAVSGRAARAESSDAEKQARALYERAEKSFDVGKFAEALTDYQAAYEAKPLPGFLFNIAQCYRNMGNYERARFFFRRYLTLEPHAPNHRRVEELIAEMSKQIDAQAAAAAATTPPPAEQKPVEQKPGEAKSGEAKPGEATPGEASTAPPPAETPPLAAPAAPPPSESSVPMLTTTAPAAEESHPAYKRWWFWTGVGAVVVGGAVAAFFLTRPKTEIPGSLDHIDGR
jgi:tetratricopeptide (TPR) repeat protein